MAKVSTPRTPEQFIEYRLNETDSKIINLGTKIDGLGTKIENNYASREYVDDKIKPLLEKISFLYRAVWGVITLVMLAVGVTLLYSIGLRTH